MAENKIPFAWSVELNKIVSVRQVKRGLACNCTCPSCSRPVEACLGEKRRYFRHAKSTEGIAYQCKYAPETSIHKAAKSVLKKGMTIWLPAIVFSPGNQVEDIVISPQREILIDHVEEEVWDGKVVPDLIVYSGTEKIYVEIFVSHKVPESKKEKLRRIGIKTLEIDLSWYDRNEGDLDISDVESLVCGENKYKRWVYCGEEYERYADILRRCRLHKFLRDGEFDMHVIGCPIAGESDANGYEYANCEECRYRVSINDGYFGFDEDKGNTVLCSAEVPFSFVDPSLSEEEMRRDLNVRHEAWKKRKAAREEEARKRREAEEAEQRRIAEENKKRAAEETERRRKAEAAEKAIMEAAAAERESRKKAYMHSLLDESGTIRCKICGRMVTKADAWMYQGDEGYCRNCTPEHKELNTAKTSRWMCPDCDGEMSLRYGRYGPYRKCPKCGHTEKAL